MVLCLWTQKILQVFEIFFLVWNGLKWLFWCWRLQTAAVRKKCVCNLRKISLLVMIFWIFFHFSLSLVLIYCYFNSSFETYLLRLDVRCWKWLGKIFIAIFHYSLRNIAIFSYIVTSWWTNRTVLIWKWKNKYSTFKSMGTQVLK